MRVPGCTLFLLRGCCGAFACLLLSRCVRYALSEMFLLLPVLLLVCIPAYQIFVKGDTRSGSSGALGEGLTSGDGLADQSDKIDLNEPGAPPPALAGGGNGGEPGGPPPEIPSEGPITAL